MYNWAIYIYYFADFHNLGCREYFDVGNEQLNKVVAYYTNNRCKNNVANAFISTLCATVVYV